jgi:murein DD-endopeptidase MepM/ murein hydrolase activator NlpD
MGFMGKMVQGLTVLAALGLGAAILWTANERTQETQPFDPQWVKLSPLEIATLPLADHWEQPMGSERGALTYNAQPFRITRHLGDDLNGIGGYNSDLGDAVYATALGKVVYKAVPGPGWGKVIIVAHRVRGADGKLKVVQSMYAHLEDWQVNYGDLVQRGQQIGTVGTADGRYLAHLHLEIRRGPYVNPSLGYADAPLNRESPESFILQRIQDLP